MANLSVQRALETEEEEEGQRFAEARERRERERDRDREPKPPATQKPPEPPERDDRPAAPPEPPKPAPAPAQTVREQTKGLVAVTDTYAKKNPRAVTKVGDYYYRPAIDAGDYQSFKKLGLTNTEIYEKLLTPKGKLELAIRTRAIPPTAVVVDKDNPLAVATKMGITYTLPKAIKSVFPMATDIDLKLWGRYQIKDRKTGKNIIVPKALHDEQMKFEITLQGDNPNLYRIYDKKGYNAYIEAAQAEYDKAINKVKEFQNSHTKLPDGEYVANKDLADMKRDTPILHDALVNNGYKLTFGELNRLKDNNPKGYFKALQAYELVPKNAMYYGSLPDGTVKYIGLPKVPDVKKLADKTAKEIGLFAADMVVPGVWARHWNKMPTWEKGVNIGLDLIFVVPLAGWGARLAGKAILKAGTSTISKSLARELPKALIKAGERQLAAESVKLSKEIKGIDRLYGKVEKTAKAVAKAEKAGNAKRYLKAVKAEHLAKADFTDKLRKWGIDIAKLNTELAQTKVGRIGNEGLSKAVGLAGKSGEFADYIAGTQREIVRQNLSQHFVKRTASKAGRLAKAYADIPSTLREVLVAASKSVKGGTKAGAAYLRGEGKLVKATSKVKGTATEAFIKGGAKEVHKLISKVEKELAKESQKAARRLAKYKSKPKTLDMWDEFIRDIWNPGGGGKWYPRVGMPPTTGSGSGTQVQTIAATPDMQAKLSASYGNTIVEVPEAIATKAIPTKKGFEIVWVPPSVYPRVAPVPIPSPTKGEISAKVTTITKPRPEIKPFIVIPDEPNPKPVPLYPVLVPMPDPLAALKAATRTSQQASVRTATELATKLSTATGIKTGTKVATSTTTGISPAIAPGIATKTQPAVAPATSTKVKPAPSVLAKPAVAPVTTTTKTLIPPPIPVLPPTASDKRKRKYIKQRGGALAFRMGELGGKDVWHIWLSPFKDKSDFITVLGRKPAGAKLVRGDKSAYNTAQVLYGIGIDTKRSVDIGFIDAIIEPISGGKGIRITFKPDTRLATTGDITIGDRQGSRIKKGKGLFPLR